MTDPIQPHAAPRERRVPLADRCLAFFHRLFRSIQRAFSGGRPERAAAGGPARPLAPARLDVQLIADLPKGPDFERVVSTIHEKADLFIAAAADTFKVPSPTLLHSRGVGGAAPARSRLLYFNRLLYLRGAELLPAAVRAINESRLVSFALFTRGVLETAAVAGYHEQRLAVEEGATEPPADYLDRLRAAVLSGKFDWRRFITDPVSRQALVDDYDAHPKKQQPPDAAQSILVMVDELGVRLGKSIPKARGRIHLDYAMLSDMCHPSAGGNLLYVAESEPWMRAELVPQPVTLAGVATQLLPCLAYSAEALDNLIADLERLHDRLAKMDPPAPAVRPADEAHA